MPSSSTDDPDEFDGPDEYATVGVDAADMGRYADVSLEDEELQSVTFLLAH